MFQTMHGRPFHPFDPLLERAAERPALYMVSRSWHVENVPDTCHRCVLPQELWLMFCHNGAEFLPIFVLQHDVKSFGPPFFAGPRTHPRVPTRLHLRPVPIRPSTEHDECIKIWPPVSRLASPSITSLFHQQSDVRFVSEDRHGTEDLHRGSAGDGDILQLPHTRQVSRAVPIAHGGHHHILLHQILMLSFKVHKGSKGSITGGTCFLRPDFLEGKGFGKSHLKQLSAVILAAC
mmetsp:Transcript_76145/g.168194  ORF Transcript_76145/g.168194 Transcript_76145/m.168194 type:complete len:234 (-) Transcript_76145:97-798(-)